MKNLFSIVGMIIIVLEFILLVLGGSSLDSLGIFISIFMIIISSLPFFGIAHLAESNDILECKIKELEDKLNSISKAD